MFIAGHALGYIGSLPFTLPHQSTHMFLLPSVVSGTKSITTPNQQRKSGARRARQNKSPRSDAIILTGRQRLSTLTASGSGVLGYTLQVLPSNISDRMGGIGQYFTRYRIKSLTVKYISACASTLPGSFVLGFVDDTNELGTGLNADQILNLRKSVESPVWRNTSLSWTPLDNSKWYYTLNDESAGIGERFSIPCEIVLISDVATSDNNITGVLELFYSVEFAGATLAAA